MAEARVSMIKVDIPYGTRLGELVDVLTGLYLKSDDMYIPAGAYYVLLITDGIFPDSYNPYGYFEQFESIVEKVLAPVPSYDEWQELYKCAEKYENEYVRIVSNFEKLKEENAQLKEDCKDFEMIRCEARAEIKRLKEQLEIATKALEEYASSEEWADAYCDDGNYDVLYVKGLLNGFGYETAEKALNQIKQIGEKE